MQQAKLENWSIVMGITNPYQAPEQAKPAFKGEAHGHPRFDAGEEVFTGSVESFDPIKKVAYTRRTRYELGSMNSEFKNWMKTNGYRLQSYYKGHKCRCKGCDETIPVDTEFCLSHAHN